MVEVKSHLSDVDGGFWPYYLPALKAEMSAIDQVESRLGFDLPSSYRRFLGYANGWRGFFQTIDLLSCDQLLRGDEYASSGEVANPIGHKDWQTLDLDPESTVIIGGSTHEADLFVIDFSLFIDHEAPIVWIAGERIQTWPAFVDFFSSMIEYNRREIAHFLRQLNR